MPSPAMPSGTAPSSSHSHRRGKNARQPKTKRSASAGAAVKSRRPCSEACMVRSQANKPRPVAPNQAPATSAARASCAS